MKIKLNNINIDKKDPFKEDILERKESVEILTQLISETQDSLVLAIDSLWGTGKTTFVKMWQMHLENKGFSTLYFNAWENDFNDDALIALIGEIEIAIDSFETENSKLDKIQYNFEKIKRAASVLIKNSIPIALKYASAGVLDYDDLTEKAIGEITEKIAKNEINKYEESKHILTEFKEHLENFAKEITDSEKPIVFFIDELDRCRPTYALQVLEKAKHFFNVENIVFVLAIDKNQIGNSIKGIYGLDMDVDGYLRRFIDLNYHLPEPPKGAFVEALFKRFNFNKYFEERTNQSSNFRHDKEHFVSIFSELFSIFNFSLRIQEQCFTQISLVFKTTPVSLKLYPILLAVLISIKNYNLDLYKRYINGNIDSNKLMTELFSSKEGQEFLDSHYGNVIEAYLIYYDSTEVKEQLIEQYRDIKENQNTNKDIYRKAEKIMRIINDLDFAVSHNVKDYIVKKIEIMDRFQN